MIRRWIAHQFARPSGPLAGLIAPWLNRIGAPLNAAALELLQPRAGEAMLEVGFGGGALLRTLAGTGLARLAGIDRSGAMVAQARRRLDPAVELIEAGAEQLPFAPGSFDAVVGVSVLHFWPELEPPLREIARVLRDDGRVILLFETPDSLRRWPGHRHGFQLWSANDVIAAGAGIGLALDCRVDHTARKPDCFTALRLRKAGR